MLWSIPSILSFALWINHNDYLIQADAYTGEKAIKESNDWNLILTLKYLEELDSVCLSVAMQIHLTWLTSPFRFPVTFVYLPGEPKHCKTSEDIVKATEQTEALVQN